MRVLVVEDASRIAAVLKRGLQEEGYIVDLTRNGEDAVGQAGEFPDGAIVLNVMLPIYDGFEACRQREADTSGRFSRRSFAA